MKKILFRIAALTLLIFPMKASAITLTYTANIGAADTDCSHQGYISPSTDTRNQGDDLTINFHNEKTIPLQIRYIPGGYFDVAGGATVSKTFTTTNTFSYEAWLTDGSCKKAVATITVNPANAQAPPDTPIQSTPNQTNNETPSAPEQAEDSSDNASPESSATDVGDPNLKIEPAQKKYNGWRLWLVILVPLLVVGGYLLWRKRRK